MKVKNPYLLPEDVEPAHYKISLVPDLQNFAFLGHETVTINVLKQTSKITFHAVDLKIKFADLASQHGSIGFRQDKVSYNKKFETVTLTSIVPINPGKYFLNICFDGELNDKMYGFYRTSYELNGEKKWGAATQFESTDARRCFPCWDEPAKKATFEITLTVPKDLTAVSNMPLRNEAYLENGYKTVSFEQSPKMSTYLVCFVVAHLNYIQDQDHNRVPLKLYAVPGKEEHGRFAMECDKSSLEFYERKFGISYQSIAPKKDMIACPDFASGAMENLGAVTYRETAALIDPANDTAAARERVAKVVMHENAHMWFGDLVTMKWWNGLWLNEGFATFMSHCAMHDKFPEWEVWTSYVAGDFRSALRLDSLKNSHPIEIDVKNPYEIREIFDEITYAKGSVVNRMAKQYLGEKYWEGLRIYLKRYSYKNTDTTDLWQALEEASGKPVRDIMASYTRQPGYPVVFAKGEWKSIESKQWAFKLKLEQKRFLSDGSKDKKNLLWKIPIGILTKNFNSKELVMDHFLMENRTYSTIIPRYTLDQHWFKLNAGQSGFYRVVYSHELWEPLVTAVRRSEIPNLDRIGLLDDSMALAKAGYMKTSQALDMIAAQENDKEFDSNVWSVLISNLGALDHILEDDKGNKEKLASFAKEILRPAFEKLGWDKLPNEKHTDTLLRSMLIRALGSYDDQKIISEAEKRFSDYLNGKNLNPDLKGVVYYLVAENGDKKELADLIKLYDATQDASEKEKIQVALGYFKSEAIIKKVIEFSLSDKVRKQDWFRIMVMLGRNSKARLIAWNFLKENWDDFKKKYEGNLTLLVRTLEGVTSEFADKKNLADIKMFFKTHPLAEAKRTMKQVIETIETNIKWKNRDKEDIAKWLKTSA